MPDVTLLGFNHKSSLGILLSSSDVMACFKLPVSWAMLSLLPGLKECHFYVEKQQITIYQRDISGD